MLRMHGKEILSFIRFSYVIGCEVIECGLIHPYGHLSFNLSNNVENGRWDLIMENAYERGEEGSGLPRVTL